MNEEQYVEIIQRLTRIEERSVTHGELTKSRRFTITSFIAIAAVAVGLAGVIN